MDDHSKPFKEEGAKVMAATPSLASAPAIAFDPSSDTAHCACGTLAELCKIHLPHINIAIAARPVESAIVAYLNEAAAEPWGSIAVDIESVDEIDVLADELPETEAHSHGRLALLQDLKHLASTYFAVSRAGRITVQIAFINTDMCRLFHADHIDLRLLCTYCGKGTEWLTEGNTVRAGLGKGCNDNICRDRTKVRTINPFSVGLLKGTRYPGNASFGAVHRSPPIVGSDEPWRVMVKIDAIDQPSTPIRSIPE